MALIDDLTSYYKFDETSGTTAIDIHGSNDGTFSAGVTINQTESMIGKSYLFAGDSTPPVLDITTSGHAGDFSVQIWFRRASGGDATSQRLIQGEGGDLFGMSLQMPELIIAGGGADEFATGWLPEEDVWYHLVYVQNTGNELIYISGSENTTNADTRVFTDNNWAIGSEVTANRNYAGYMDEVAFWDRALSPSEVSQLYNSGAGLAYPFTNIHAISKTDSISLTDTHSIIVGAQTHNIAKTDSISLVDTSSISFVEGPETYNISKIDSISLSDTKTINDGKDYTVRDVESFEADFGDWTQDATDDIDWSRGTTTPSSNTGPDHAQDGSYFIFIEASDPNFPSKTANLELDTSGDNYSNGGKVEFYYHMFGTGMGNLYFESYYSGAWHTEWSKEGQQHTSESEAYDLATVTFPVGTSKIRFRGVTGDSWSSDMAIDHIVVYSSNLISGTANKNTFYVWDGGSWIELNHYEYFRVKKRQNQASEFEIKIYDISTTQKAYFKEQAEVLFFAGTKMILKGRIQNIEYASAYEVIATGLGMEAKLLDKQFIKAGDNRVQYTNESAQTIATEINDDVLTTASSGLWDTDFGNISMRFEHANRLNAIAKTADAIDYYWWVSQTSSDNYDVDYLNLASNQGETSSQKTFSIGSTSTKTTQQKDISNVVNYVYGLGYGDGVNQLKTSVYAASTQSSFLGANITATDSSILLSDATDFDETGTARMAEEQFTYAGIDSNTLT